MHLLQKEFMEKILYQFVRGEIYISYETMKKKMVKSTFNSSKVNEVVDNNSNRYRSMIMKAMRMNQSYASECSIIKAMLGFR